VPRGEVIARELIRALLTYHRLQPNLVIYFANSCLTMYMCHRQMSQFPTKEWCCQNTAGLGSCKFNGEGYTCQALLVNHPSHHTIENIQADAEVIAMFTNPTGGNLCVSTLVRVNPHQTSASSFQCVHSLSGQSERSIHACQFR